MRPNLRHLSAVGAMEMAAAEPVPFTPKNMLDFDDGDEFEFERPKLLIVGHGRHGKDTVAEFFGELGGYTWTSSSLACAEHVCLPWFNSAEHLPSYANAEDCFKDRHGRTPAHRSEGFEFYEHREQWFLAISQYNTPDKTRLARKILETSDMYVGMRSRKELWACKAGGVFDFVIWVDGSERHEPEAPGSMQIEPWMADFHIDNNGTLNETRLNVQRLVGYLEDISYAS